MYICALSAYNLLCELNYSFCDTLRVLLGCGLFASVPVSDTLLTVRLPCAVVPIMISELDGTGYFQFIHIQLNVVR